MENKTESQAQMLANRLQKRLRHLKKWAQRTGTCAFRLYDRDIPEIPLVLDFYGSPCQKDGSPSVRFEDAALCGALYKRPYEKDEQEEESWLSAMKTSASSALEIKPEHLFLKRRQKQRGASQYEKTTGDSFEKIIGEGGLLFKVNLSSCIDCGLFIDRRLMRALVRNEAAGKKVLNLFSYTGSFSVYAAAGGAASTDSVDLSNTYLNWARENFSLNGFSSCLLKKNILTAARLPAPAAKLQAPAAKFQAPGLEFQGGRGENERHRLIHGDALDFVNNAIAAKKCWDIIVLDPPAFSNSKRTALNFDLNRDLTELLDKCLKILSPCGKIFLSVNLRRGAPTTAEIQEKTASISRSEAFSFIAVDLKNRITDEDFKGRKIPKAFLLEKNKS